MSPTPGAHRPETCPADARARPGWGALAASLLPLALGVAATALGLGPALRNLFRRTTHHCLPGRSCPRAVYDGFDALADSPATAVAFFLWLLLASVGLALVARCLRRGTTAVRTVGAGIGLLYLGLVGLLLTGLFG
jgi:hypothetical protein